MSLFLLTFTTLLIILLRPPFIHDPIRLFVSIHAELTLHNGVKANDGDDVPYVILHGVIIDQFSVIVVEVPI